MVWYKYVLLFMLLAGCNSNVLYEGVVVHGTGFAARLGFPTANVAVEHLDLESGVYCCRASVGGSTFNGMCYASNETRKDIIEVHIFDFRRDIHGRIVSLNMLKKVRKPEKFDAVEHLVAAVKKDEKVCRLFFK